MKKTTMALMMVAALGMAGCESMNNVGTKQAIGGVSGAALGGLAGSQIGGGSGRLWATGAGVLIGALIGSEIGNSLDNADRAMANQANQRALNSPIGEQITWNNPDSGNYGTVVPVRDGRSATGSYCREYTQTINVGGRSERAYGTACRQPDGSWQIVNN